MSTGSIAVSNTCSIAYWQIGLHTTTVQCTVWGFPGGSNVKESACSAGDLGLTPGPGRAPGEGIDRQPILVFLPREFHGQRSLVGYRPWGHKEWDTTESLTLSLSFFTVPSLDYLTVKSWLTHNRFYSGIKEPIDKLKITFQSSPCTGSGLLATLKNRIFL